MKINNILWATDGSEEANYALKYAKYFAELNRASIIGLHVIPMPVELLFESMRDLGEEYENWRLNVEKDISSMFAKVQKELAKSGIKFEGVILKGSPNGKIREYTKKSKADLVIVGKHGHGFIDNMVAGSETLKVLKKSIVPVLAVKGTNKKRKINIKNILVPIDFTEYNESALVYALDLAQLIGADIRVIYALSLNMYAQNIPSGALEIVINNSEEHLKKQVQDIKKKYGKPSRIKDINIETEVIHGLNPSLSITNYARSNKSDLIIIHTHGKTGVKKFLLGSVTEKVVNWSECSVLALNPK